MELLLSRTASGIADGRDERQVMASVVMLTTDQRIDRRILLEADSLEKAGWRVRIIAMQTDGVVVNDHPLVIRLGASNAVPTA
jgi:hypothetical protein